MKVGIIGIGSIGSLFASRLSPLTEIIMIGSWPDQLASINESGLFLLHPNGKQSRSDVTATDDVNVAMGADIALVVVKGWQTERAADLARQIIQSDGLVITLQNGLGNLEILSKIVGEDRVTLGVTSEGAMMVAPGVVKHAGIGVTHIATTFDKVEILVKLVDLLQLAGFETHLVDTVDGLAWGKLAVNTGINPLTALLQVPNGFLASNRLARRLMLEAAEETALVARAQKIKLPYDSASERVMEVAIATAANRSSMAQDVARGMPTEIDNISGAVVRKGEEFGVDTPVNKALLFLIKAQIESGHWRTQVNNLSREMRPELAQLAELEAYA